MIDFWKESNREVLRKDKLVFNPDINLDELKAEIEERKLEIRKPANSEGKPTSQGELFS